MIMLAAGQKPSRINRERCHHSGTMYRTRRHIQTGWAGSVWAWACSWWSGSSLPSFARSAARGTEHRVMEPAAAVMAGAAVAAVMPEAAAVTGAVAAAVILVVAAVAAILAAVAAEEIGNPRRAFRSTLRSPPARG